MVGDITMKQSNLEKTDRFIKEIIDFDIFKLEMKDLLDQTATTLEYLQNYQ